MICGCLHVYQVHQVWCVRALRYKDQDFYSHIVSKSICVYTFIIINLCIYMYPYIYISTHIFIYIYLSMYIYVSIFFCIYCIYIYIYLYLLHILCLPGLNDEWNRFHSRGKLAKWHVREVCLRNLQSQDSPQVYHLTWGYLKNFINQITNLRLKILDGIWEIPGARGFVFYLY